MLSSPPAPRDAEIREGQQGFRDSQQNIGDCEKEVSRPDVPNSKRLVRRSNARMSICTDCVQIRRYSARNLRPLKG